jgi:phytanoyl-CoA hydroxylase
MHFTAAQIESYKTNGYLLGPKVLSDEQIVTLKQRIDDILEERVDFPAHLRGETTKVSSAKGQLPSVKVVNLFRHDEVFARVWDNPAIGSLAHDLMAGPVRLWEDQMIYKPPFDAKAVLGWHQDYTFWNHVGPADMGTCWIALDDATVDNGCMYVVPGSHQWDLSYTRLDVDLNDPEWLLKRPDIPAAADRTPVPCPVPAGHCHFHHCRLFHGSYGNKTDNVRRTYILHLMPGYTHRLGDDWNDRMAGVQDVEIGAIVQGPSFPELPAPVEA